MIVLKNNDLSDIRIYKVKIFIKLLKIFLKLLILKITLSVIP